MYTGGLLLTVFSPVFAHRLPVLLVHVRHSAEVTTLEDAVVAALEELVDHAAFFRCRQILSFGCVGGIL